MRKHIDKYLDVITGIVFMHESVHGVIDPLPSHVAVRLEKSIVDKRSDKTIQSQINYLHKTNRINELKQVLVELKKLDSFFGFYKSYRSFK